MTHCDVLVLLSFVAIHLLNTSEADSTLCKSCCGPSCVQVQPTNISFVMVIDSQPKFEVVIVPSNPIYAGLDNVCWSFFNLTQNTVTLFTTEIYCNDFVVTDAYQVAQTAPGVLQFGSTLCNFQGTIFGQLIIKEESCNVILIYLCFLFGECDLEPTNKSPVVFGLSPESSELSPLCVYKVTDLIDRAGFGTQDYFVLPRKQSKQCAENYSN